MKSAERNQKEDEIDMIRQALDAETQRCLDLQRQLDRANAEFEEFISMAAHNLREPVREVACFSQLIAQTSAGRLDAEADILLGRIQEDAARMQSLLSDVVDYWATAPRDLLATRTDMEASLRQVLISMEKQINERKAIVTYDSLPVVMGDAEILVKVLRHLIKNAIEFCDSPVPRVHISSRRASSEYVFSVRDNGPGIDPAFQKRIFGVFKRLRGKEFPGNGLGLSFCNKAIERLGGRMSIDSQLGTGSTFNFTLPAAD